MWIGGRVFYGSRTTVQVDCTVLYALYWCSLYDRLINLPSVNYCGTVVGIECQVLVTMNLNRYIETLSLS